MTFEPDHRFEPDGEDLARIHACAEPATLDRQVDNVLGAKTAADVLSGTDWGGCA